MIPIPPTRPLRPLDYYRLARRNGKSHEEAIKLFSKRDRKLLLKEALESLSFQVEKKQKVNCGKVMETTLIIALSAYLIIGISLMVLINFELC